MRRTFKDYFSQGLKDAGWEKTPISYKPIIERDERTPIQPMTNHAGTITHFPCPSCDGEMVSDANGCTCIECGYKEQRAA